MGIWRAFVRSLKRRGSKRHGVMGSFKLGWCSKARASSAVMGPRCCANVACEASAPQSLTLTRRKSRGGYSQNAQGFTFTMAKEPPPPSFALIVRATSSQLRRNRLGPARYPTSQTKLGCLCDGDPRQRLNEGPSAPRGNSECDSARHKKLYGQSSARCFPTNPESNG
jgi:hypothetical protein